MSVGKGEDRSYPNQKFRWCLEITPKSKRGNGELMPKEGMDGSSQLDGQVKPINHIIDQVGKLRVLNKSINGICSRPASLLFRWLIFSPRRSRFLRSHYYNNNGTCRNLHWSDDQGNIIPVPEDQLYLHQRPLVIKFKCRISHAFLRHLDLPLIDR